MLAVNEADILFVIELLGVVVGDANDTPDTDDDAETLAIRELLAVNEADILFVIELLGVFVCEKEAVGDLDEATDVDIDGDTLVL